MQARVTGVLIYPPPTAPTPSTEIVSAALAALREAFPEATVYLGPARSLSEESQLLQVLHDNNVQFLSDSPSAEGVAADPPADPAATLSDCLTRWSAQAEPALQDQDSIAICYGWYVLLDLELTAAALADHRNYLAHFTYSDNIPAGFLPDFASAEFVRALPPAGLTEDLRAFVFKNIDRYDVEIFYRSPDLRQYRLDLSAGTSRSLWMLNEIRRLQPTLRFSDLAEFLRKHAEILRPYPAYFEVELCAGSALRPYHPPRPSNPDASPAGEPRALTDELIEKLRADIAQEALPGDVSVAFGGTGESFAHPRFLEVVERFAELPAVKQIFIETYGVGVRREQLEALCRLPGAGRVTIIIRLDTLQAARYRELYGADCLADVLTLIDWLNELLPAPSAPASQSHGADAGGPRAYVEMRRLAENEDELSAFMDRFEAPDQAVRPLLQKYNRFIDRLPERRAADLTPLTRDFCWHLARDFYLTADGQVPVCKQDPYGENPATADFRQSSVREIVARTMPYHVASVRGEHDRVPMPCLRCDEWYTFNG